MVKESKYCTDIVEKHFNKELVMTIKDNEDFENFTVYVNRVSTGGRGEGGEGTMYHRGIFLSRTLERQMILN